MNGTNLIKEYGVPSGKIVGSFGLDNIDEVIMELFEEKDKVLNAASTGEIITFQNFNPYNVTGNVALHEKGLLIKFEEHNDQNAKHEDAGKAELYILDDDIAYIITQVDKRINEEYKINQDISREYRKKIGNKVKIPAEISAATKLSERINCFFNRNKRIKQIDDRNHDLFRIEEYMNKLILSDIDDEE